MAFVNLKNKEIQVKIVYYGPGRGGKTTNLEYVYKKFRKRINTEMVTVKTHGDRTLFFDFLPFDIGVINGYDVKIQLYTVPGQVKYNLTRKYVLTGADAVVFVVDSVRAQLENNEYALENLAENLAANGLRVPGVQGMVWSGTAIGDWTLSCVTGRVDSVTFVFDDGSRRLGYCTDTGVFTSLLERRLALVRITRGDHLADLGSL